MTCTPVWVSTCAHTTLVGLSGGDVCECGVGSFNCRCGLLVGGGAHLVGGRVEPVGGGGGVCGVVQVNLHQ